jgi:hypothetical protein
VADIRLCCWFVFLFVITQSVLCNGSPVTCSCTTTDQQRARASWLRKEEPLIQVSQSLIHGSACGFSKSWVKFLWVAWVSDWANPIWPSCILNLNPAATRRREETQRNFVGRGELTKIDELHHDGSTAISRSERAPVRQYSAARYCFMSWLFLLGAACWKDSVGLILLKRLGMVIWVRVSDIRRVPNPIGMGMGMIFYSYVAHVPDLNWDGYGTGIFSHPRVIRWVPDTLLPL